MKLINHTFKEKKHYIYNNIVDKKIVLISDIHYSSSFKKEKLNLIVNKLKNINPDYICITGDLVDHSDVLNNKVLKKDVLDFIRQLTKISKTIMCIGNHEQALLLKRGFKAKLKYKDNKEWFCELNNIKNFYLLDNEKLKEKDINFVGVTLPFNYYINDEKSIKKELNKIPKLDNKSYNILLIHCPINIVKEENYSKLKNINLILAGHTHNGVVPPIIDDLLNNNYGIYSPNGNWFFKAKFNRGRYDFKDKTLIINGAITKIHECSPKILQYFNELFPMSLDIIYLKKQ